MTATTYGLPSFDLLKKSIQNVGAYQCEQQKQLIGLNIKDKGLNQLVSEVDVASEKMLVEAALECLPNSCFISEEETITQRIKNAPWRWIIDPLDGTTNFLHGLPIYSISVALQLEEKTVAAWVYCPALNHFFEAEKGAGAYMNGNKIMVSKVSSLNTSLLATGFPYYTFNEMPAYLDALAYFMQNTHGLRRMGSAAIDLAYVAWGKFDGFFELNLSPWDVAAGILLVEEAGGKCTEFNGNENPLFANSIVASNTLLHPEITNQLNTYFN